MSVVNYTGDPSEECLGDCPACCHYDDCYVDGDDEPRCPYYEKEILGIGEEAET